MSRNKKISFVIPCYYSQDTVSKVVDLIIKEFPTEKNDIEIILVNDGSKDNTWDVISRLAEKNEYIIALNLSKNFGQDAARMAGYAHATGDYIISLDDDGQNPPSEAHILLDKIEEGYDVVFGKYHKKKDSAFKTFGHNMNELMAHIMLGKPKELTLQSYFVMNKFVKDEIIKYEGPFSYVWGLILRTTSNVTDVYINHEARTEGESTYTFSKLLNLWLNGFTSFSIKPLRVATFTGTIIACLGFVYAIVIIVSKLTVGIETTGWATLMSLILIVSGIQLIMLGLVGEYVGRIFMNDNKAPQYIIREVAGEKEVDDE